VGKAGGGHEIAIDTEVGRAGGGCENWGVVAVWFGGAAAGVAGLVGGALPPDSEKQSKAWKTET